MASSSSSAQLRLMSDLKSIVNEPPEGCSASPFSDDNLFVWSATIFGPDETPWEGGVFSLRLTFTENYPEKPPRVRFTSDIFHPNVYHDGTLCMDIIQDAWSPCHNVATILTSIQSLLTDPNPSSPANPEAAQLFQHDVQAYNKFVTLHQSTLPPPPPSKNYMHTLDMTLGSVACTTWEASGGTVDIYLIKLPISTLGIWESVSCPQLVNRIVKEPTQPKA